MLQTGTGQKHVSQFVTFHPFHSELVCFCFSLLCCVVATLTQTLPFSFWFFVQCVNLSISVFYCVNFSYGRSKHIWVKEKCLLLGWNKTVSVFQHKFLYPSNKQMKINMSSQKLGEQQDLFVLRVFPTWWSSMMSLFFFGKFQKMDLDERKKFWGRYLLSLLPPGPGQGR